MPRAKKKYNLHETEQSELLKWMIDHAYPKNGIGSEYFYRYHALQSVSQRGTQIGTVSIAHCACGLSKDITNYELW